MMSPLALLLALAAAPTPLPAQPGSAALAGDRSQAARSVIGSKHDLSMATGRASLRAASETRVCVFCHGAHGTGEAASNRPDQIGTSEGYRSASMKATAAPGPTGASRVCLSCHDGTVAVGQTRQGRIPMTGQSPSGVLPVGASRLGTDLRGSHPVSVPVVASGKLHAPAQADHVRLDRKGQVQCTSCHDPHRQAGPSGEGKFLVAGTRRGDLCLACHASSQYQGAGASHSTPVSAAAAAQPAAGQATLGDLGCGACHLSHGGDGLGRLIRRPAGQADDVVCLGCHDGKGARTDLGRDVAKPYGHAVPGPHDSTEGPTSATFRLPESTPGARRHAVCSDCHEAHLATSRRADAPLAVGALAGVWGIDAGGNRVAEARFEYEVCFKCHADSANQPQGRGPNLPDTVRRATVDLNLRRVFDPSAASFHPVVAPSRGGASPSLKAPLAPASLIRCTDCHASDTGPGAGGTGPRGPHGSSFAHLLERSYLTADGTPESESAYALCYKCHDRAVVLSLPTAQKKSTFPLHGRHLTTARATCSACHNAHGISSMAGAQTSNAHLVDFDLSVVKPNQFGARRYTSRGPGAGSCALNCHGHEHADAQQQYP